MARRYRYSFTAIMLIICIFGGMLLQGCAGPTVTPVPDVLEEPAGTEERAPEGTPPTDAPEPTELPMFLPTLESLPPWCDNPDDLKVQLAYLDQDPPLDAYVEVCLTGGLGVYTVATSDLPADLKEGALGADGFPSRTLLGYFEVFNGDPPLQVYTFDPPLQLRIVYSQAAWNQALEDTVAYDLGRPRAAYLALKGEGWHGVWLELEDDTILEVYSPDSEEWTTGFGVIIFEIFELPDPLIGGC